MRAFAPKPNRPREGQTPGFTRPGRATDSAAAAAPAFAYDFGRISVHAQAPVQVQAKMEVSDPGDAHEQEADRAAERLSDVPGRSDRVPSQAESPRAFDAGETAAPPSVREALQEPGRPLDAGTREFMESRFGHDFSHVRVHAGERAAHSAQLLNARAYAVGRDLVFGPNQYAPATPAGRRLIAHELTHVVQQGGGAAGGVLRRDLDRPRSLAATLNTASLSDEALAREIIAIHRWLENNPTNQAGAQLRENLRALHAEAEARVRRVQSEQTQAGPSSSSLAYAATLAVGVGAAVAVPAANQAARVGAGEILTALIPVMGRGAAVLSAGVAAFLTVTLWTNDIAGREDEETRELERIGLQARRAAAARAMQLLAAAASAVTAGTLLASSAAVRQVLENTRQAISIADRFIQANRQLRNRCPDALAEYERAKLAFTTLITRPQFSGDELMRIISELQAAITALLECAGVPTPGGSGMN